MERPRRRIWQIQLPTALALMIGAAFLIHLNTACKGKVRNGHVDEFAYGFPCLAYSGEASPRDYDSNGPIAEQLQFIREHGVWEWKFGAAAIDAFCAGVLLFTVGFVSEKLLPPPKLARDWSKLRREARWSKRGARL